MLHLPNICTIIEDESTMGPDLSGYHIGEFYPNHIVNLEQISTLFNAELNRNKCKICGDKIIKYRRI